MLGKLFKNRIFSNASWLIGCKVAKAILSFVITILTARFLGTSNYGLISYAASIIVFVEPIAQLGLRDIQVHEIVNNPEKEGEIIGTSIFLSFLSSVICFLGVFVFVSLVNAGETVTLIVCLLYGILLFFQAGEIIQYWFQAKYLMKYSAIICLLAYLAVSIYKIVLLLLGSSVYWFAISNAIDYILISVALYAFYKIKGGCTLKISRWMMLDLLKKGIPFIIPNLMISIFSQTDRIMLKNMLGNSSTGIYSAAYTCASIGNFVFLAIIDAFRPSIFQNVDNNNAKYKKQVSQLYCIIIYLSIAMCVFVSLLSSFIINITYGNDFSESSLVLSILIWFSVFSYIGSVNSVCILAEKKQKYLWIITLSGAVSNIVLNYFFINLWGTIGAALSSLLTQFFSNIIVVMLIGPVRNIIKYIFNGLNPFILGKEKTNE